MSDGAEDGRRRVDDAVAERAEEEDQVGGVRRTAELRRAKKGIRTRRCTVEAERGSERSPRTSPRRKRAVDGVRARGCGRCGCSGGVNGEDICAPEYESSRRCGGRRERAEHSRGRDTER